MGSLLEEVNRKYEAACRLQSVEFEITHRCPCSCPHCYLTAPIAEELTTGEIDASFAQLREEGVIELALTGGDPLVREDLPEVLELAHRERFLVSLLTTGVRIGPAQVRQFSRAGVRSVEMSLLGATARTHDRLMRHAGAFDKTLGAVRLLREAGIPVLLKATALKGNCGEIPAMAELAAGVGAGFSANSLLVAGVDGDPGPLQWELGAGEAADADGGCLERGPEASGAVLTCKAGKTHAAIAPNGAVLPCVLFRRPVGNLRRQSVRDIWHDGVDPFLRRLRELKPEDVKECFACAQRSECRRCPALAYAETGDITVRIERGCLLNE